MKTFTAILLMLLLGCTHDDSKTSVPVPKKINQGQFESQPVTEMASDFLEGAKAMNGKGTAKPVSKYKKGHVNHRPLLEKAKKIDIGLSIKLPGKYPIPTPSYYQGKLYVSGGFGSKTFYCFDAKTGKNIWAVNLDDDGPSSAVIEDGVVVFNTESCTIFALDAKTGEVLHPRQE